VREVSLGDGLTRFEHGHRHPLHHHIVCTQCEKVIEFASPELERMQDEIMARYGFQPDRHWVRTQGVCSDCRERRRGGGGLPCDTERVFARDAVKMALAIESMLLEFFRAAAAANRDVAGKEVFDRAGRLKEGHVAELGAQLDELVREEDGLDQAPQFLHFDLEGIERKIPGLARREKAGPAGELCLEAAAAAKLVRFLAAAAADFSRGCAAKFPDTRGARILLVFAGRAESHGDLF